MRDATAEHRNMLVQWQNRLGLTDWTILLKEECLPDEMTLSDVCGESEWSESVRSAAIRILREDCYGDRIRPFDFERTLVHELLHLKFALLDESGNALQDRYLHQLIDDLARAFVDVRKGGTVYYERRKGIAQTLQEDANKVTIQNCSEHNHADR